MLTVLKSIPDNAVCVAILAVSKYFGNILGGGTSVLLALNLIFKRVCIIEASISKVKDGDGGLSGTWEMLSEYQIEDGQVMIPLIPW